MQTSPRQVLIVDDEALLRRALVRSLKRQGWQAVEAEGAEQGLALLEQQGFQVVLSDYLMPGMNGVAFLARVKERWPQVLRILVTGHVEPQALMEAINRSEVYRFVTKPWDERELWTILVSAFERYELREQELQRLRRAPAGGELPGQIPEPALGSNEFPMALPGEGARALPAGPADGANEPEVAGEDRRGNLPFSNSEASSLELAEARVSDDGSLPKSDGEGAVAREAVALAMRGDPRAAGGMIRGAKLAAVESIADAVAHETNNALSTILALAQMMQRDSGRSADDLESLRDIGEAALRCEELVGALARLGGGSPGGVPFELRDAVGDALLLQRLQLKHRVGVCLEERLTDEPLRIRGDPSLVQQAIGAVLAQATSRALEAGEQQVQVQLLSRRRGESAEVVVLDHGLPLGEEELRGLVEPSFAGADGGEVGGGALAVCSAIAGRHGGSLEIGKREGRGNSYALRFPLIG